jgi:outer membrane protein OmpA-like peptidoglycan-associated protein
MIRIFLFLTLLFNSIYIFPQGSKPVVLISGKVLNERNMQAVDVDVKVIYEILPEGTEAGIARINPVDGSYKIILPYGKIYGYMAYAKGFYSVTKSLNVENLKEYTEIDEQNLFLAPLKEDQVVRLNNIFFKDKTAELESSSYPELNRFVEFLKTNKKTIIEIGSHTDNTLEDKESNELTNNRAKAIVDYLISKKIKVNRIQYKGYGLRFPLGFNNNEEGRALNNRIEFKIISL